MAKKRPPTKVELEQIMKALKPGEIKQFPQFDLTIRKPREMQQTGFPIGLDKLGKSKVIKKRSK
jgi:hypothetical protein